MLFDLRGKGRRNTVRVIYASLAILMGGGLVLFGIGGEVSGGLLNAFENESGNQDVDEALTKRVEEFEARVKSNPRDAEAWAELARGRYQIAGLGDNFDPATGAYTEEGQARLQDAAKAWERHVAIANTPDADVANIMVQAFGPAGLNELEKAVAAMEIVVEQRDESAALYGQLAQLAYLAGQTRKGDLSAKKALELAEPDQRPQLKQTLDSFKAQAAIQSAQTATNVPTVTAPASTTGTTETTTTP